MAMKVFYANRRVVLGAEKKDANGVGKRTEVNAGETIKLDSDDRDVKNLVERGALTPAPEAPKAPKEPQTPPAGGENKTPPAGDEGKGGK
jgi:hypothetical protein